MNPEFSKKLKILSFISIIGVLVAHSYFVENNAWEINAFIQDWIGCQIVRFCIPLFFFISGYLFFRETKDGGGIQKILRKMRTRSHSLILPYLLWNLLFFLSIIFLQLIPDIGSKINSDFLTLLQTKSIPELFLFIFWEPAAFHLWFLQYLILFVLFCPIFYVLFHSKWATVVIFLILCVTMGIYGWGGENMQGLLAFLMGGFISYNGINIERQQNKNAIFIPSGLYLIWCAVNCFYPEFQLPFLNMLRLTLGAYSVWTLYDLFSAKKNWLDKIISWAPYTFFIYVFHEPWINIYKKAITLFLPPLKLLYLFGYFTTPLIILLASIVIARILQKNTGTAYSILTGGRH